MKSVMVPKYCNCDDVGCFEEGERVDGRSLAPGPVAVEADTTGGGQDLKLTDSFREVAQAGPAYRT